jgi:two-component system CheB/CheR fusion protein
MPGEENHIFSATILVVEDDPDTRKLLKTFLEAIGHQVSVSSTARDGLAALAGHRFDVLISDIGLPDGNGWELLQKAPPQSVSLAIAMSGFAQPSDRTKSQVAGYQHHLLKPFDPTELSVILDDFTHSTNRRGVTNAVRGQKWDEDACDKR